MELLEQVELNRRVIIATGIVSLALAGRSDAQQYGQWTWSASLGLSQRNIEKIADDLSSTVVDENEARFSFGIKGFIFSPAIASIQLGIDTDLVDRGEDLAFDTNRLGYRASISLFPQGNYPARFYVRNQTADYSDPTSSLPFRLPDTTTSWGARLRSREGPWKGVLVGVDRASISYIDEDARSDQVASSFLDWSRELARVHHTLRIKQDHRTMSALGYTLDDLAVNLSERATIRTWNWSLLGQGLSRNWEFRDARQAGIASYRIGNRLTKTNQSGAWWDLEQVNGFTRFDGDRARTHDIVVRHGRILREGLSILPFAGFMIQQTSRGDLSSPRLGCTISWVGRTHGFDLSSTGHIALSRVESSGDTASDTRKSQTYFVGLSASRDLGQRFRAQIDSSFSVNEFRQAGELLEADNEVIPIIATGGENARKARLTLSRNWGGSSISAYSEFLDRESVHTTSLDSFQFASRQLSLQATHRSFGLLVSRSDSTVTRNREQVIETFSGSVFYSPIRLLRLNAQYRSSRRDLDPEPPVSGERLELGLSLRIGAFLIESHVFSAIETVDPDSMREDRGFQAGIRRQFGGLLPLVTAPKRRGVIR